MGLAIFFCKEPGIKYLKSLRGTVSVAYFFFSVFQLFKNVAYFYIA